MELFKKKTQLFLVLAFVVALFCACSDDSNETEVDTTSDSSGIDSNTDTGSDSSSDTGSDTGSDTESDSSSDTITVNCPNGQILCDDQCTNPLTDDDYCGASDTCNENAGTAGVSCGAGYDCQQGVCVISCIECAIKDTCYSQGEANPKNECQICDTATSKTSWSNTDSTSCDDGLFCTTDDTCNSGVCEGTPTVCDDGVACNGVETCNESSDVCDEGSTTCLVYEQCDTNADSCEFSDSCLPGGCDGGSCDDSQGFIDCSCDPGDVVCDYACVVLGNSTVDIEQTSSNLAVGSGVAGDIFGQTFVPSVTGYLTQLDIPVNDTNGANSIVVTISGPCSDSNPCSNALYSESFPFAAGVNSFVFTEPVPLTAGETYTWKATSSQFIGLVFSTLDPYADGRSIRHAGSDHLFTTYMWGCP